MSALTIVKSAAELLVSVGAGAVVGNAIKASIPTTAKTANKISIAIGGLVISGMVGEAAAKYATTNIDNALSQFKQVKDVVVEAAKDESE